MKLIEAAPTSGLPGKARGSPLFKESRVAAFWLTSVERYWVLLGYGSMGVIAGNPVGYWRSLAGPVAI